MFGILEKGTRKDVKSVVEEQEVSLGMIDPTSGRWKNIIIIVIHHHHHLHYQIICIWMFICSMIKLEEHSREICYIIISLINPHLGDVNTISFIYCFAADNVSIVSSQNQDIFSECSFKLSLEGFCKVMT